MAKGKNKTPAWQRKEGKDPKGGLNAKGRASYNKQTGAILNLRPPIQRTKKMQLGVNPFVLVWKA